MKNHNLEIKDNGIYINDTLINEDIFQEEKCGYCVVYREDQIKDLYMWISEAINDEKRSNDADLMKEDLHYLESLKDDWVFSSVFTNEFIAKSDDLKGFNEICEEILKLNKEFIK